MNNPSSCTCADGFFASSTSPLSCTAWTACSANEYESTPGTASANRECTALTTCTDAQYESNEATATSDRVCTALTMCAAGKYVSTDSTATSDQICSSCDAGTFTDTSDAKSCTAWSTCPLGHGLAVAGTSQADQQCESCVFMSTYSPADDNTPCLTVTTCGGSEFETMQATVSSDRVCATHSDCAANHFTSKAPTETATASAVWTACTAENTSQRRPLLRRIGSAQR